MNQRNCIKVLKKFNFARFFSIWRFTLVLIMLIILSIMILSFGIISMKVTAKNLSSSQKLVTSVRIQKGDSLWSIASQYITDEYKDMNTYINEIKKCNGLTSDVIHEDNYILIPYYSTNLVASTE